MKLLLIAPADFPKPHIPDFDKIEQLSLSDNLETDIQEIKNHNADLIIIPAEKKCKESHLLGGIELLIWLRINEIYTHVVITSFYPLQTILQKTKQGFILVSKGVTFHHLPKQTTESYFAGLVDDKADKENLKGYLSAMFDIANFRHAYANVWGLKRLVEVHKNYYPTFDDSKVKNPSIENSITYKMAEFIFGIDLTEVVTDKNLNYYLNHEPNRDYSKDKGGAIQKIRDLVVKRYDKKTGQDKVVDKILLIDDQANTGWVDLLKSILPCSISLENIAIEEHETESSLKTKFLKLYNDDDYLMVILDLRLLKTEEHEHNYENLLSVKLMQKMLSDKIDNVYKYPNLKFVLFTASNQLHNMLSVLSKNEYTPHRIFIKEGFDINHTADQLYKNYLSLLECIHQTAIANFRGKPKKLESYTLEEQKRIDNFQISISDNSWQIELNKIYVNELRDYTHIVLDTNIFYLDKPLVPLSPDAKIVLCYPVFLEMRRHSEERGDTYKKFCAEYFLELYKDNVDKTSLTFEQIINIENQFNNGNSEFADSYFENVLKFYATQNTNKILFVSNDKNGKAGNTHNLSPIKAIKNWVNQSNIRNVTVATIYNGNFKIEKLTAFNKSNLRQSQNHHRGGLTNSDTTVMRTAPQEKMPVQSPQTKQGHTKPKIKWSNCVLHSNQYELKTTLNGKEVIIAVGQNFRQGFKANFEKLQKTSEEMELKFNAETKKYNIEKISEWISKAKKL